MKLCLRIWKLALDLDVRLFSRRSPRRLTVRLLGWTWTSKAVEAEPEQEADKMVTL